MSAVCAAQTDAPANEPGQKIEAENKDPGAHLRFGASLAGGWQIPYPAIVLQGETRIGVQFTNLLSVYLSAGGLVGFGLGRNMNSDELTATLFGQLVSSVMVEAIFANVFYVAAGPGLGYGEFRVAGTTALSTEQTNIRASGFKPTIDARLGVALGGASRSGLNIGLSGLLMFHPNSRV